MKSTKILCLFVLCGGIISLLFSCSVQKRLYNKGFYVQKQRIHTSKETVHETALTTNTIEEEEPIPAIPTDSLLEESNALNSKCDTVFLANGETVICTIDHMENEQLYVQTCDEEVVPKMVFNKKEVLRIHYGNGDVEEIRKMTKEEQQQQLEEKKITVEQREGAATKLHPIYFISLGLMLIAIVLFFIALELSTGFELFLLALIFSIGALVVSIISLAIHSKSRPRKMLGLGLTIADVIISAISVIVTVFATFIELIFEL